LISIETLHKFCLYSGLVGAGLYFAVVQWFKKHNKPINGDANTRHLS
jgi:hypothetical protein